MTRYPVFSIPIALLSKLSNRSFSFVPVGAEKPRSVLLSLRWV